MPDLSRVRLPGSGRIYDLKDAKARADIAGIKATITGAMAFVGVTETRLYDGARTNPILINDDDLYVSTGNVAIFETREFIFNGSVWQEFGSSGSLRSLAFKDDVSAEYTPEGSITKPIFTGKPASMSATIVPRGRITVSESSGEATYTPEGTVTAPIVEITPQYETITPYVGGRLPTCTLPTLSMVVNGENLSFEWAEGSFDPGAVGQQGEEMTIMTGVESVRVSAPQFQGTGAHLTGNFVGQDSQISIEYTPEGTISTPLFEGVETTITSS